MADREKKGEDRIQKFEYCNNEKSFFNEIQGRIQIEKALKRYGCPKNVPKNEEEKKKIIA